MLSRRALLLGLAALPALPRLGRAQGGLLNIYSARHYDTDQTLYDGFTTATGVGIRLIEAPADQLIERIRAEGRNSPADVLITVGAGRLERARQAGVLQPAGSASLAERVPASLRDPGGHWFGISKRIRVLFHDRARPLPAGLAWS